MIVPINFERNEAFLVGISNLKETEYLLKTIVEKSPAFIFLYREKFIYANPTFEKFTGYSLGELKTKSPWELVHPDEAKNVKEMVFKRINGNKLDRNYRFLKIISKDGQEKFAELITTTVKFKNRFTGLGIGIDRTEEKLLEKKFLKVYYYDELTGLPNRRSFMMKLRKAINYAQKNNHSIAVILLDIKNFKLINERYGFRIGDELLKQVSRRLESIIYKVDTVARIGADKFAILIYSFKDPVKLTKIIRKLSEKVTGRYNLNGESVFIDVKFGITVFPKDGNDEEKLLKNAELALTRAKQNPDRIFDFYSEDYTKEIVKILDIKEKLRTAINKDQIVLYFQPIVEINSLNFKMAEILVRLNGSRNELIPPEEFIPIAEQSGLIFELGNKIIEKSSKYINEIDNIKFSINISPVQLKRSDFCYEVSRTFEEKGVDLNKIIIELTETSIMENAQENVKKLRKLKSKGISVAVDDFGTGYSSLNYLKILPIDYLKIDTSFIKKIGKDKDYEAIIKTIISIAKIFKLETIAEGVETEEQLLFLKENGCNYAQGFLFSKPLPFEEFRKLISSPRFQ